MKQLRTLSEDYDNEDTVLRHGAGGILCGGGGIIVFVASGCLRFLFLFSRRCSKSGLLSMGSFIWPVCGTRMLCAKLESRMVSLPL